MITLVQRLDASGLECPLPLLKMKLALNKMLKDEVLEVIATDMSANRDFKAFCEMTENEMLSCDINNDQIIFKIRKG